MSDGGKGSSPRPFSVSQEEFDNRWENIFGKKHISFDVTEEEDEAWKDLERKNMTPKVEDMKKGTCGCGRSPTGDCCGWHALSEQEFAHRKELYETGKVDLTGREVK